MATPKGGRHVRLKMVGNWGGFISGVDPKKFDSSLKRNITHATEISARYITRQIQARLHGGGSYKSNARLTVIIKGGSTPLMDTGEFAAAFGYRRKRWNDFHIGLMRSQIHGMDADYLAKILHDGASIPVTDAMRAMFKMLWMVSIGETSPDKLTGRAAEIWDKFQRHGDPDDVILPLDPSTKTIHIPGRPFMRDTFRDPRTRGFVQAQWTIALRRSMPPVRRA